MASKHPPEEQAVIRRSAPTPTDRTGNSAGQTYREPVIPPHAALGKIRFGARHE